MRLLARTAYSLLASALAGVLVAYLLTVEMRGLEEYAGLLILPALFAVAVCVLLLVARLRPDPLRAAGRIAKVLLALLLLGFVALALLFLIAEGPETLMSDGVILLGVFVPAIAVVTVQWLTFGRRALEQPIRFGRGPA